MPTRRRTKCRHRGRGIGSWLGKANAFLKQHKVISRLGKHYTGSNPKIKLGLKLAGMAGYGRKRGGALRLAGSGFRITGGRLR